MKKIVYVAHEISGNIKGNIKNIREICKQIHLSGDIPFAPYLLSLQYLDDKIPFQREIGIELNHELLKRGFIDEMRVFGTRVSKGVFGELEIALRLGISVRSYDPRIKDELDIALEGLSRGITLAKDLVYKSELKNNNILLIKHEKDLINGILALSL